MDFMVYTRSQIEAMSETEKTDLILRLLQVVADLGGAWQSAQQRIKDLEARQNQNSGNSSKPPSKVSCRCSRARLSTTAGGPISSMPVDTACATHICCAS